MPKQIKLPFYSLNCEVKFSPPTNYPDSIGKVIRWDIYNVWVVWTSKVTGKPMDALPYPHFVIEVI